MQCPRLLTNAIVIQDSIEGWAIWQRQSRVSPKPVMSKYDPNTTVRGILACVQRRLPFSIGCVFFVQISFQYLPTRTLTLTKKVKSQDCR